MITKEDLDGLCTGGWKWRYDIHRPTIRYIDVPFDITFIFDSGRDKDLDINKLKKEIRRKLLKFLDETTIERMSVIE